MDEAAFQAFAWDAQSAVEAKLEAIHERYGLARAARWTTDTPTKDAPRFRVFDAENRVLFSCVTLELGTFFPADSTWRWGWANPSLSAAQRERLLQLRELAAITNREAFRYEDAFKTDHDGAWMIAAMVAEHLGAAGCFDAKIKNSDGEVLHAYLAYMEVLHSEIDPELAARSAAADVVSPERRDGAGRAEPPTDAAEPPTHAAELHPAAPDRPRGMVSVGIAMTAAEVLFFERCLKTLDSRPALDDLDDDFRRGFGATPERVLGELQPLSHDEQRVPVSFRFRGKDGDPQDICDITSLNVDIAALAMLIAVAAPSALPTGFPYTPTGPDFDRDDLRFRAPPDGGVVKITPATIVIVGDDASPAREFRQWTFHVP